MTDDAPDSPCINVCSLDAHGCCIGCYRTIEEIARWAYFSPNEKRAVLQRSSERARTRALTIP
jgi:predicted Fe-S protein YdhL (DUF1289 family)